MCPRRRGLPFPRRQGAPVQISRSVTVEVGSIAHGAVRPWPSSIARPALWTTGLEPSDICGGAGGAGGPSVVGGCRSAGEARSTVESATFGFRGAPC